MPHQIEAARAKAVVFAMSGVDKSLEGGKKYWGAPAEEARKKWREVAILRQLAGTNGDQ